MDGWMVGDVTDVGSPAKYCPLPLSQCPSDIISHAPLQVLFWQPSGCAGSYRTEGEQTGNRPYSWALCDVGAVPSYPPFQ